VTTVRTSKFEWNARTTHPLVTLDCQWQVPNGHNPSYTIHRKPSI